VRSEVQVIACPLLPSGCIFREEIYEGSRAPSVIRVTVLRIWRPGGGPGLGGLLIGAERGFGAVENQSCVEIRPLVVATIQRLPQRTIESIRPTPGTVSPCAARQAPLGPSSTTVPPATSRIVQPSIVVGRVSDIAGLGETLVRSCVAAAADAMLLVVDGSLLAAVLARRGLRERSCQRLMGLAPEAAAFAAAPAIACRSVLAAQAIS
jgi:hypothetical protein